MTQKTQSTGRRSHRIVDISVALQAGIASDPPGLQPHIEYRTHQDTADDLLAFFPGAQRSDLPDGEGWAIERVEMTTHSGTHLDAPYHYASTMDSGRPAITIDEVPLDWCFQPGVNLISATSTTATSSLPTTSTPN